MKADNGHEAGHEAGLVACGRHKKYYFFDPGGQENKISLDTLPKSISSLGFLSNLTE